MSGTGNHAVSLHSDYTDDADSVWRFLNTTEQVHSIFEIAAQTGLTPKTIQQTLEHLGREGLAEKAEHNLWGVLPGIVSRGGE